MKMLGGHSTRYSVNISDWFIRYSPYINGI